MENAHESAPRASSLRLGWLTLAAGILALAAYFASRLLLENPALTPRLPVALAPLPFFLLFLVGFIRLVSRMDELERRIQLEALAFAYPAVLVLLMTLGLLQLAGVALSPADWSFRHVWQIGVVLYVCGIAVASRRYGALT
jgi:hypothetical protein